MIDFKNKTAVITGAAGGIGFALASECARRGMNLVLTDIEDKALNKAEERLDAPGIKTLSGDIRDAAFVKDLADLCYREFGSADLLFNNAGVAAGSSIWDTTAEDWDWVMGVNFQGVLNGTREFIPRMLAQDSPCHVVNTASVAGLVSYHPSAAYQVSKHAVAALSEQLYHSLTLKQRKIGVTLVCPGWVNTKILEAERNRPVGVQKSEKNREEEIVRASFQRAVDKAMSPETLADMIFQAIEKNQFYLLPDPTWKDLVSQRMNEILEEKNPASSAALNGFLSDKRALAELAAAQLREKSSGFLKRFSRNRSRR
ncbi:MAG: SDR family NAD(P)-dependent oxidoreductase [Spirochaetales bacterium]|nr:SDR family NAD(P)-dependent oxidoreductase [Spirochaetales bacterium]